MKTKYIIVDCMGKFANTEGPIIFPEFEAHSVLANRYGGKNHVISAGFVIVSVTNNSQVKIHCHGESVSLGIESRPEEDARIIQRMLAYYE